MRYGHARNDILFDKRREAEIRNSVRDYFKLEHDVKIMLYAPTFRDDGNVQYLNLDYASLKDTLEKRFGGQWVILIRMHHKNKWVNDLNIRNNEWLLNATGYLDMQELIVAADAGLTDYSSWAYDFVLTRRPLFLYTPDLDNYDQERGFYYSIDSTPFPLAYTNEGLCENILNFNQAIYLNKVEAFLEEKGCYETGQAAKLVVDKIEELMGLNA